MEVSKIIDEVFEVRGLKSKEYKDACIEIVERLKESETAKEEIDTKHEKSKIFKFLRWYSGLAGGRRPSKKVHSWIVDQYFTMER